VRSGMGSKLAPSVRAGQVALYRCSSLPC